MQNGVICRRNSVVFCLDTSWTHGKRFSPKERVSATGVPGNGFNFAWSEDPSCPSFPIWAWAKIRPLGDRWLSPTYFHIPGFHCGHTFLTHYMSCRRSKKTSTRSSPMSKTTSSGRCVCQKTCCTKSSAFETRGVFFSGGPGNPAERVPLTYGVLWLWICLFFYLFIRWKKSPLSPLFWGRVPLLK